MDHSMDARRYAFVEKRKMELYKLEKQPKKMLMSISPKTRKALFVDDLIDIKSID